MTDGSADGSGTAEPHHPKNRHNGLLVIGAFKLIEAVFFLFVGLGAIHYLHGDLGDAALHMAEKLKMDPGGHLVSFVMDHVDEITARRLKEIGVFTFLYAAIRVVEGVGLVMERVWAEYLTAGVTLSFLPWELIEIARKPNWFRICLFLVNATVLIYLLWVLRRKHPGHWNRFIG